MHHAGQSLRRHRQLGIVGNRAALGIAALVASAWGRRRLGGVARRIWRLVAGRPNDGSVLIFLAQNMVELHQMARGIGLGVWGAITEFQRLASAGAAEAGLPFPAEMR